MVFGSLAIATLILRKSRMPSTALVSPETGRKRCADFFGKEFGVAGSRKIQSGDSRNGATGAILPKETHGR